MTPFRSHATPVWIALMAATFAVGVVTETGGLDARSAVLAALAVAAFKARLIAVHFMELRHAPAGWRRFFTVWAVACAGAIGAAFWIAGG